VALGDAILACLTERPMTGYELAKTFDASIGFFWKADHQQIYRELSRLRDRGHIRGREVVQSGKPNKLVYTLTSEGRAALKHWAARPSSPPSIKDDLLVRLYALDCIDIEPLRADLMARLEHHRDRFGRYERILKKRFPDGTAAPADAGKLLALHISLRVVRRGTGSLVVHFHQDQRPASRGQPARKQGMTCCAWPFKDGAEVRNPLGAGAARSARPPWVRPSSASR